MCKKKVSAVLILVLSFCFFLTVLPSFAVEPKHGGTLRIGIKTPQYSRIDVRHPGPPALAPSFTMIYDGLVTEGPKGVDIVPALATSWETKDNKVWIFNIRKGVKFHNGKELTAQDVVDNFQWFIKVPEGWKPPKRRGLLRGLQKAEAVDKYTVKVTLKAAFSQFPAMLATAMRGIAPPEGVYKHDKDYYKYAVGTGPYKVVNAEDQKLLILERNDEYWGPKPYIDRLEFVFIRSDEARFIALQKGELDIAMVGFQSLPKIKEDADLEWEEVTLFTTNSKYYLNTRRWPMSDVRFRRALWMGIDWESVTINTSPFKSGKPVKSFLQGTPYESKENIDLVPKYNPEEAKKLVQAVVKDAGKKIRPIKLILINKPQTKEIAQLMQLNYKQIGIPVELEAHTFVKYGSVFLRDPKMDWDLGDHAHGFAPSPSRGFSYFVTGSGTGADGNSLGGYSNPEYDKQVALFESATDKNAQIKAAQAAEKILIQDAAAIPYAYNNNLLAWNKKVKGVVNTPLSNINVTTHWGANMWLDN
jgi:peptide/nickel transport system substrate-binding protein